MWVVRSMAHGALRLPSRAFTIGSRWSGVAGPGALMSSYYESTDLAKFGQIGEHGKALADEFFKYYGMVTGADGALTRREKALIALAISHS